MKRGENEVAGQRGLHGDLGGGAVANLADGDHFGILPQQRLEARFIVEAGDRPHLRLGDAGHHGFHRVFERGDAARMLLAVR